MTGTQRAALYDAENPWAADDHFFRTLVNEHAASRVLDLGCGTGRLTLVLAADGHRVVGVDPDPASLAAARRKPGARNVTWIDGTSAQLPRELTFDVALMTAHVAQAIHDDAEWSRTLAAVNRALVLGGLLAFDTRDPTDHAWERWTPATTRRTRTLPDGTSVETWMDCALENDGLVTLTEHRLVQGSVEETHTSKLAFRSEGQLRHDLNTAGFTVERILGGWTGEDVGNGQGELIVIARAGSPES